MARKMIPFKRIKIEPSVMRELTKRSDAKGFTQVLTQLFVTVLLGITAYWAFKTQPLWISIPVFYIYTTVHSFSWLTAAIHELSHNTVFKTKRLNGFFSAVFATMSWSDYVFFNLSHTQHHAYTTYRGMDEEVELPIKITWYFVLQKFTIDFTKLFTDDILQSIPSIFRRSLGIIKPGREENLLAGNEKKRKKLIRMARVTVITHLMIVVFIISTKEWLLLLLITFAPLFGQWLSIIVSLTQHTGLEPNQNDFRRNCRSMTLGPITGFLYWQMNHHIEHHMYGGVPFYNLKKLNKVIGDQLPPRTGLLGSWIEIIDTLKKQKDDPYYYRHLDMPEL